MLLRTCLGYAAAADAAAIAVKGVYRCVCVCVCAQYLVCTFPLQSLCRAVVLISFSQRLSPEAKAVAYLTQARIADRRHSLTSPVPTTATALGAAN